MKKLLILTLLALSCASVVRADGTAESSFTATNDNRALAMKASTSTIPHILTAIIVSSASAGGTLTIFNSSFTTSVMSTVAVIGLNSVGYYPFYDLRLKGLVYNTAGNVFGVTIIYKQ